MRDALPGGRPRQPPRLTLEDGRYRGYLEAHIEQGGYAGGQSTSASAW